MLSVPCLHSTALCAVCAVYLHYAACVAGPLGRSISAQTHGHPGILVPSRSQSQGAKSVCEGGSLCYQLCARFCYKMVYCGIFSDALWDL